LQSSLLLIDVPSEFFVHAIVVALCRMLELPDRVRVPLMQFPIAAPVKLAPLIQREIRRDSIAEGD
jgi:hypothetical protein